MRFPRKRVSTVAEATGRPAADSIRRHQPLTAEDQRENVRVACEALAPLAAEHEPVISHGNGPQVGLLALQASACGDVETYPPDVLDAQTEGMIGYLIEQELGNLLWPETPIATLPTMVELDPGDPAFDRPTVARRSGQLAQPMPGADSRASARVAVAAGRAGSDARRGEPDRLNAGALRSWPLASFVALADALSWVWAILFVPVGDVVVLTEAPGVPTDAWDAPPLDLDAAVAHALGEAG